MQLLSAQAGAIVGVRDLFAGGYFIPGGARQTGGLGAAVTRHTWPDPVRGKGLTRTTGPISARQVPAWSRMGPYISRTLIQSLIQVSRVIRLGKSGPVRSYWFQGVSVGTLLWHNRTRGGSTDRLTVPYRCTNNVLTSTDVPIVPPGARWYLTAA